MSLSLEMAKKIMARAEKKAQELGVSMVIAMVDEGSNLKMLHRMDDALLVSISIAKGKAYTAAVVRKSTAELGKEAQPGEPIFGFPTVGEKPLVIFGGGLPIMAGAQCLGGIGVSGGSVEEDIMVAEYAIKDVK